ncbi:MAG: diacylglycerol kinase family protein [Muribaculaceae bacterium]
MEKFSWKKRALGFKYAYNGIWHVISTQHNAWIHCAAAAAVIVAGIIFAISTVEWIIVIMCMAAVLAAESFNTALEILANRITDRQDEAIGLAKDVAAGAVLFTAIGSAIVGLIIFIPKISALL